MIDPADCESLSDIREGIDHLDRCIIKAMGERMRYVKAAARFKPTEASIAAPERVAAMLPNRRGWAEDVGLDGKFIECLYAQIIQWYISEQTEHWRCRQGAQA